MSHKRDLLATEPSGGYLEPVEHSAINWEFLAAQRKAARAAKELKPEFTSITLSRRTIRREGEAVRALRAA